MVPYEKFTHFTGRIISVDFWKDVRTKNMAHLLFFIHLPHIMQLIKNSTSYTTCQDLQWSETHIKNLCTASPAGQIHMNSVLTVSIYT